MTIKFLATQERIERTVTVDEYIDMMDGKIKAMIAVMSKFVLAADGVSYLDPAEARKLLGGLTLSELQEAFKSFNARLDAGAVPNGSVAS